MKRHAITLKKDSFYTLRLLQEIRPDVCIIKNFDVRYQAHNGEIFEFRSVHGEIFTVDTEFNEVVETLYGNAGIDDLESYEFYKLITIEPIDE